MREAANGRPFPAGKVIEGAVAEPLLVRPGCRYQCHGDGTCCTNIHVIGPISRNDAGRVRIAGTIVFPSRREPVVKHDAGIEGQVVIQHNGACVFLGDNARCRIHEAMGPEYKPTACRRFPVGATHTPAGVRVTLSHRCACVSIGHSEPLEEEHARRILVSPWTGRLLRDFEVTQRVRWYGRTSIPFEDYVTWERSMIASLDRDDGPSLETVLGIAADSLPQMRRTGWAGVADKMAKWTEDEPFGDGFSCILRWAEGVVRHGPEWMGPHPNRPWGWTFERAAARSPQQNPERRIYGSWLADELWAMQWASRGTLYRAMADMAARYRIALGIAAVMRRQGLRTDVAAAEAVMIADTLGAWDTWNEVRRYFEEAPGGTF